MSLQTASPISLSAAAAAFRFDRRALRAGVESGRLRYIERRPWKRGERILFDRVQLEEDLAGLPRCRSAGCDGRVLRDGGYCGAHCISAAQEGAAAAQGDLLATKRDWYTAAEAQRVSGASTATLFKAIKNGDLASELVGKHRRISRTALRQWRSSRTPGHKRPTPEQREKRRLRVLELNAQGVAQGVIARKVGSSVTAVRSDLDRSGADRPRRGQRSRRLPPDQRALREQRTVELYLAGASRRSVARELGSSQTQVMRDLRKHGVQIRPANRPALYPPATARPCLYCGQVFTPPFPAAGDQRFCTDRCGRKARRAAYDQALVDRGLRSTAEAADRLGVGVCRIQVLLASGELIGEQFRFALQARPAWGVSDAELDRFERQWARGAGHNNPSRRYWLDPKRAVAHLKRTGAIAARARKLKRTPAEQEVLELDRRKQRAKQVGRRRAGRKAAEAPAPDHLRWAARFEDLSPELHAKWEQDKALGLKAGRRPSREAVAIAVALEDWPQHREAWRNYPAARNDPQTFEFRLQPSAADRVLKAINRLQKAGTKIPAK